MSAFLQGLQSPRRVLALVVGGLLVGSGLVLVYRQVGTGTVAFIIGAGLVLIASGVFLSERRQYWVLVLTAVLNLIGAILSYVA